jgi:hypothetical protein
MDVSPAAASKTNRRQQTKKFAFHPLANIFPPIEGPEFYALVDDIATNGQNEPIVILDEQVLDGRNRYRACLEAGVEPTFVPFKGEDPRAKPEYFRELIDRQWPHGPRVELFRHGDAPEGWTVWGNEVVA